MSLFPGLTLLLVADNHFNLTLRLNSHSCQVVTLLINFRKNNVISYEDCLVVIIFVEILLKTCFFTCQIN
jgi:hypothetical protein